MADYLLPPIFAWVVVSIALFVAASLVSTWTGARYPGIPSIGRALLIVAALLVAGAAFLGLGLVVLLVVPVIILTLRVVRQPRNDQTQCNRWSLWLARGNTAALILLVVFSLFSRIERTTADYVLQWQLTGPGSAMLGRLCSRGPEALSDLRVIAVNAHPTSAARVAPAIARFGMPVRDVPVLIESYAHAVGDSYAEPIIEKALRELSGIDLPQGSTPQEWSKHWKAARNSDRQGGT